MIPHDGVEEANGRKVIPSLQIDCAKRNLSPQQRHRIRGEFQIVADKRQVLVDRLGNQKPIKRVSVTPLYQGALSFVTVPKGVDFW